MNKTTPLLLLITLLALTACNDTGEAHQKSQNQSQIPSPSSPLTAFMDSKKVCQIVSISAVQKIMQIKQAVETRVENYGGSYNCEYSWEGTQYGEFTVSLSIYDSNREVFPPKKLSEAELNNKIEEMVKDMDKRNNGKNKMAYDYAKKTIIAEEKTANNFEVLNGMGNAAILIKSKSESILTTVVENTKLTLSMQNSFNLRSKNPPHSEAAKQLAQLILKGKKGE